jgi:hypothetical protein
MKTVIRTIHWPRLHDHFFYISFQGMPPSGPDWRLTAYLRPWLILESTA